jgi:6-phosphogluconolactonase (cycloisomerase 2 family)
VHRIRPDGTIGELVPPAARLDAGIYGHQVRVDPSNQAVILVTRGNGPTATKPEDPGALKIFSYHHGVLANWISIAPDGGFNYQVRHLDFHPSGRWVYVTLERQNQIHVYGRMADGTLSAKPLFVRDTLMQATEKRAGQAVASIHVHPSGKFLYAANRATATTDFDGQRVFAGGENTIAVFAINNETGDLALIQSADTHGFQPRTFGLDSTGSFLAVANQSPLAVRDRTGVRVVTASLTLFRVREDGRLALAQRKEVTTTRDTNLFWTGFVSLP